MSRHAFERIAKQALTSLFYTTVLLSEIVTAHPFWGCYEPVSYEYIPDATSATLRQEVDLNQLHEQLLAVVQETMQPVSLSLWIRPLKQQASGGAAGGSPSRREEQPGVERQDSP